MQELLSSVIAVTIQSICEEFVREHVKAMSGDKSSATKARRLSGALTKSLKQYRAASLTEEKRDDNLPSIMSVTYNASSARPLEYNLTSIGAAGFKPLRAARSDQDWTNAPIWTDSFIPPYTVASFDDNGLKVIAANAKKILEKEKEIKDMKRLVQVIIVDPDKKVPVESSVLYMDEKPRLTDLTDQELFFEVPIKDLLDKHNDNRTNLEVEEDDKGEIKKRKLKAIKIRDLRMVVLSIAEFN